MLRNSFSVEGRKDDNHRRPSGIEDQGSEVKDGNVNVTEKKTDSLKGDGGSIFLYTLTNVNISRRDLLGSVKRVEF